MTSAPLPPHTPHSSTCAVPPHSSLQSCVNAASSNTVPSFNAANNPNAGILRVGSAPVKIPDANTTALLPPKPDNGAVNAAMISPVAGATPNV